jgi:hypothetical protein
MHRRESLDHATLDLMGTVDGDDAEPEPVFTELAVTKGYKFRQIRKLRANISELKDQLDHVDEEAKTVAQHIKATRATDSEDVEALHVQLRGHIVSRARLLLQLFKSTKQLIRLLRALKKRNPAKIAAEKAAARAFLAAYLAEKSLTRAHILVERQARNKNITSLPYKPSAAFGVIKRKLVKARKAARRTARSRKSIARLVQKLAQVSVARKLTDLGERYEFIQNKTIQAERLFSAVKRYIAAIRGEIRKRRGLVSLYKRASRFVRILPDINAAIARRPWMARARVMRAGVVDRTNRAAIINAALTNTSSSMAAQKAKRVKLDAELRVAQQLFNSTNSSLFTFYKERNQLMRDNIDTAEQDIEDLNRKIAKLLARQRGLKAAYNNRETLRDKQEARAAKALRKELKRLARALRTLLRQRRQALRGSRRTYTRAFNARASRHEKRLSELRGIFEKDKKYLIKTFGPGRKMCRAGIPVKFHPRWRRFVDILNVVYRKFRRTSRALAVKSAGSRRRRNMLSRKLLQRLGAIRNRAREALWTKLNITSLDGENDPQCATLENQFYKEQLAAIGKFQNATHVAEAWYEKNKGIAINTTAEALIRKSFVAPIQKARAALAAAKAAAKKQSKARAVARRIATRRLKAQLRFVGEDVLRVTRVRNQLETMLRKWASSVPAPVALIDHVGDAEPLTNSSLPEGKTRFSFAVLTYISLDALPW